MNSLEIGLKLGERGLISDFEAIYARDYLRRKGLTIRDDLIEKKTTAIIAEPNKNKIITRDSVVTYIGHNMWYAGGES